MRKLKRKDLEMMMKCQFVVKGSVTMFVFLLKPGDNSGLLLLRLLFFRLESLTKAGFIFVRINVMESKYMLNLPLYNLSRNKGKARVRDNYCYCSCFVFNKMTLFSVDALMK